MRSIHVFISYINLSLLINRFFFFFEKKMAIEICLAESVAVFEIERKEARKILGETFRHLLF